MCYIPKGLGVLVFTNITLYFFLFQSDWYKIIPYTLVFISFMLFQYFRIGNPKIGDAILT